MNLHAAGVTPFSKGRQNRLGMQTYKVCSTLSHLCKLEVLIVMKDGLLLIWRNSLYIRGRSCPAAAAALTPSAYDTAMTSTTQLEAVLCYRQGPNALRQPNHAAPNRRSKRKRGTSDATDIANDPNHEWVCGALMLQPSGKVPIASKLIYRAIWLHWTLAGVSPSHRLCMFPMKVWSSTFGNRTAQADIPQLQLE